MALHQLFTLAFALQLEPLPTLDYVAAHHDDDQEPGNDDFRVGANTFLEPIVSRHPPHPVHTISFLLQHTNALDAVAPWSDLIALLARADDDPSFKNLREFFDARYDDSGRLIGADPPPKKPSSPTRRLRSASRSTAFAPPTRRSSQAAADGRKASFAQSIGGAAALKLGWLRKNTGESAGASHGDFSDDEVQSSHSRDGSLPQPKAYYAASEIQFVRTQGTGNAECVSVPVAASSVTPTGAGKGGQSVKTVRFNVRLDLHSVGLAPHPPRSARRQSGASSHPRRVSDPSEASSIERVPSRAPSGRYEGAALAGGQDLAQAISPISSRSFGGLSDEMHDSNHAGVETPSSPTARRKGSSTSLAGAGPPGGSSAGGASGKATRRPSMMSKLLDFGLRKRSTTERSDTIDSRDGTGSEASSQHAPSEQGGSHLAHAKRVPSGLSHLRANGSFNRGHSGDEDEGDNDDEALDLAEEEDGEAGAEGEGGAASARVARRGSSHRQLGEPAQLSRRRSSNGSSGRAGLLQSAISMEPDLGPVREDGTFEIERFTTRSSIDARSISALGDVEPSDEAREAQDRMLADGRDFISLLRAASEMALRLAEAAGEQRQADEGSNSSLAAAEGGPATTPRNEMDAQPQWMSDKARGKRPEASGNTTPSGSGAGPQVRPKTSSVPSTPSIKERSFDLERSPNPFARSDAHGASSGDDGNRHSVEPWWPCGEVDPLPVSISCALGQALGWEGIMQLCYGRGSRSAAEGSYAPLGRAAALDEANKRHERTVLAWRTGVASADEAAPHGEEPIPPSVDTTASTRSELDSFSTSIGERLNLVDDVHGAAQPATAGTQNAGIATGNGGPEATVAPNANAHANGPAPYALTTLKDLLGQHSEEGRTWQDWMNLARSIQGWIQDYETTRVRAGLAHEIGVEPTPRAPASAAVAAPDTQSNGLDPVEAKIDIDAGTAAAGAEAFRTASILSDPGAATDVDLQPCLSPRQLQVPAVFGSPESGSAKLGRSSSISGSSFGARMARRQQQQQQSHQQQHKQSAVEVVPECVLRDLVDRRYGFRRRGGIPEGLPAGPDGEEFEDYSWSRQKLDARHFATALTIGSDSLSHMLGQVQRSDWVHASAWELDYLEMCVFKSPLVAERFPPPGSAIVPSARSYQPSEGTQDRTKLCPNPDENGCWSSAEWKRWLTTIREGQIIVPAIGWQAWWTLISVLNGADRTGRTYDLQVKTPEEPFEALTDLGAVYI
ncbi:uncharacterized protein PFL1_01219 [Pseudozyma flocculosa PF-1]|uniref:Uncharacterized protein n=1 Tax=Pseudozyma flocculosa TaxID=84751 RepID=A0A5C3EU46_9BASI|nr:uncharacterized protein PFL1_01219 [Pseudozyma flocculosa PF-1]EPQ31030.1 hypothetical protein PFL1_01219 [Pseudozyma flocculosa PF-1]SPO35873.1 uncharacterized protein PSFLO_01344 [Pseudozyma flocculosa]